MTAYRKALLKTRVQRTQKQETDSLRRRFGLNRPRKANLKVLGEKSEPLLEELARKGAETRVQDMIEAEVEDHIGRQRYERKPSSQHTGYRNGHARVGPWPPGADRLPSIPPSCEQPRSHLPPKS